MCICECQYFYARAGVDVWATITLIYSGGRMAILNYNIDCAFSGNTLAIHGSKEAIEVKFIKIKFSSYFFNFVIQLCLFCLYLYC